MNEIRILDKNFRELITEQAIKKRIEELARQINIELEGKDVVFLGILNGAFLFAADLFRRIEFSAKISFVKLASYEGASSSGSIKELIGWNEDIKNKTIVVIEDIVDTGNTIECIVNELAIRKAHEVRIASLFLNLLLILRIYVLIMLDLKYPMILWSVTVWIIMVMDEIFHLFMH